MFRRIVSVAESSKKTIFLNYVCVCVASELRMNPRPPTVCLPAAAPNENRRRIDLEPGLPWLAFVPVVRIVLL